MIIAVQKMDMVRVQSAVNEAWSVMTRAEKDAWNKTLTDKWLYERMQVVRHGYLDKSHPMIFIYNKAAFQGINYKAAGFDYVIPREIPPSRIGAAQDPFLHPAPQYIKGKGILLKVETTIAPLQAAHWFTPECQLEPRCRILFGGKIKQKKKFINIDNSKLLVFPIPKPADLNPKKYKMRRGMFIPSDIDKPLLVGAKVVQRAEFLLEKIINVPDYRSGGEYDIDLTNIDECELYFEAGVAYACGAESAPTFSTPSVPKLVEIRRGRQAKKLIPQSPAADIKWETLTEEKMRRMEREHAFEMTRSPEEAAALAEMTYNERHRKQLFDGKQNLINLIAEIERKRPDAPPEYIAMLKESIARTDEIAKGVEEKIRRGEKGGGED